ncbi:uncharacterized protein TRAVEDRAFT_49484 [Trametes versicolor FP-101664 SS1]|uniref:uncharacterized protein n=1 Tax=Trametes versicolor (strain FP-101664) TaxID=717944 RepID=UPI0004624565|nr:uncharacterized protein TRAVEDRAFT_49484 [Trametes versicolor FP-101664 SS1]EIW56666.1 hypothetical protein TRAVEDRAFT_49484 [Trametes versicolor FP-101664 SS1]
MSNVAALEAVFTNRIVSAVALALLYYDFILTIPREVERYWTGRLTWPSLLFFLNRYIPILGQIPGIVESFGVLSESQYVPPRTSVFTVGFAAALTLLRTYALYARDRRVLVLLLGLLDIGLCVSVWVLVVGRRARNPTIAPSATLAHAGCILVLSQEEGNDLAIAWSAIMVFDVAVFVLTVLHALQVRDTWCGGYFGVILRDSTGYFAILSLFYLANILSYTLAQPMYKNISTNITNVVSTTLITRLMLNIRDPELRGPGRLSARRTRRVDTLTPTAPGASFPA